MKNKSNYLIDRPKISGLNSVQEPIYNNNILIYETDDALCTLLTTILNIQGYQTKVMSEYTIPELEQTPALVIVDAGNIEKQNGLNLCYKLKSTEEFKNTKIIVTSIIHDKELVLNTGADLYLPKPYEVSNLIKWVDNLIREFNK